MKHANSLEFYKQKLLVLSNASLGGRGKLTVKNARGLGLDET